jgi:hypothetical protein
MTKSEMYKCIMAKAQQELINTIKTELIKIGARDIALRRNLVVEEVNNQFSVVVQYVNMDGITLYNQYIGEQKEVTFEETDTILLISILEEIENNQIEIVEELSTE